MQPSKDILMDPFYQEFFFDCIWPVLISCSGLNAEMKMTDCGQYRPLPIKFSKAQLQRDAVSSFAAFLSINEPLCLGMTGSESVWCNIVQQSETGYDWFCSLMCETLQKGEQMQMWVCATDGNDSASLSIKERSKTRESKMTDEGKNEWWVKTMLFPVHPSAHRQQLLEEKQRCRVREVRSDKSVAIITQQPRVLNGGFLCHVQLPAGDKHCLAEPVNLPATLGTCPYRFNWCMHPPQRWQLMSLQQKYGSLAK